MTTPTMVHPLFQIILKGDDVDAFKQWVKEHPDVNIRALRHSCLGGPTILSNVIFWGKTKIFEYLIATLRIYDIDEIVSDNGMTILHTVVIAKSYSLVSVMINHGAKPNIQDHRGRTPISYLFDIYNISQHFHAITDVAKRLISHGADINIVDNYGKTAIYYVIMSRHLCCSETVMLIDLFIKNGFDMSIKDNEEKTIMEQAALNNHHAFQYFLELDMPFDVSEKTLKTTLKFHIIKCHHGVVELLLKRSDIAEKIHTILTSDDTGEKMINELELRLSRYRDDDGKRTRMLRFMQKVMTNETTKQIITLQHLCFARCICNNLDMRHVPKYIIEENRVFLSNCDSYGHVAMSYPDIVYDAIRKSKCKRQRC